MSEKLPREVLLYFTEERKTGYVKREAIVRKDDESWPPKIGDCVTVVWGETEVIGEILFMDGKFNVMRF